LLSPESIHLIINKGFIVAFYHDNEKSEREKKFFYQEFEDKETNNAFFDKAKKIHNSSLSVSA
jgi:hypothetical protein